MSKIQEKFEKYLEGYEYFFTKKPNGFENLFNLYSEWIFKINTSSIKNEDEIVIKHFLDSLLGNDVFNFEGKNVLDVGSGGGFPALPLAITNPGAKFTSLDSVGKKLKVIEDIAKNLGLKNLKTLQGRAEELGQDKKNREKFDTVITRAFAPWTVMLELTSCFVKEGGYILAYQTESIFEDIRKNDEVLDDLNLIIIDTFEFELPEKMGDRIIVLIQKTGKTPKKFPRKVGEPRKNPL
ncbi:16S rRNA (guanine(527)-N(7))-methyltransferase RsmG [Candidatus Gracilibacteria bacterium]|nr:16S rRNA (guanine(527)-N(7))-methyltransferase RsmG [Candidatus Gracilibacteria bacterium]